MVFCEGIAWSFPCCSHSYKVRREESAPPLSSSKGSAPASSSGSPATLPRSPSQSKAAVTEGRENKHVVGNWCSAGVSLRPCVLSLVMFGGAKPGIPHTLSCLQQSSILHPSPVKYMGKHFMTSVAGPHERCYPRLSRPHLPSSFRVRYTGPIVPLLTWVPHCLV